MSWLIRVMLVIVLSFVHFVTALHSSNLTKLCCDTKHNLDGQKILQTRYDRTAFQPYMIKPKHKLEICKQTSCPLSETKPKVKRDTKIDDNRPIWPKFFYNFIMLHQLKNVYILLEDLDFKGIVNFSDIANCHPYRQALSAGRRQIMRSLAKEINKSNATIGLILLDKRIRNFTHSMVSEKKRGLLTLSKASILHKAGILKNISSKDIWLTKRESPSRVPKSLELRINTQFYTYNTSSDSIVSISEAYRVADGWTLKQNPVGFWSQDAGLTWTMEDFWNRRKDLTGLTFHCATEHDPPYLFMDFYGGDSRYFTLSGFNYDVWKSLQDKSNFSSTFVKSVDGGWGSQNANGSFNGMVGMIQRGEVDCAVSGFGLFKERAKVNDYHSPIGHIKSFVFVIASKKSNQDGSMTYISPFTYQMWALVLTTFVMYCAGYYGIASYGKAIGENYVIDAGQSIMIITHGLLLQGAPEEPLKLSLRVAMLSIFITGFLFLAAYSACLTSFLAVKTHNFPFINDETLYYDSDYSIITIEGSANVDHYKYGTNTQRKIFKERFHLTKSTTEAVKRFQSNPGMALYWLEQSVPDLVDDACGIQAISQISLSRPLTNYLAKDWPYTALLNYHVSKMHQNGELTKLSRKWFKKQGEGCASQESGTEPLDFGMVYTLFFLLVVSVFVNTLLLFLEKRMRKGFPK